MKHVLSLYTQLTAHFNEQKIYESIKRGEINSTYYKITIKKFLILLRNFLKGLTNLRTGATEEA